MILSLLDFPPKERCYYLSPSPIVRRRLSSKTSNRSGKLISIFSAINSKVFTVGLRLPVNQGDQLGWCIPVFPSSCLYERERNSSFFWAVSKINIVTNLGVILFNNLVVPRSLKPCDTIGSYNQDEFIFGSNLVGKHAFATKNERAVI